MTDWVKHTWKVGVEDWRDDRRPVSAESMWVMAIGGLALVGMLWAVELIVKVVEP